MLIDDDFLKPYLEAVKTARAARLAVAQMTGDNEATRAALLRADEAYQRAYKVLAEMTESCTEGDGKF